MSPRRFHPRRVIILIAALGLIVTRGRGVSLAQEGAPGAVSTSGKIVGVWNGTTLASCSVSLLPDRCNAQQRVSITVIEGEGAKLIGFYKCSYGTQNCFHMNETGKVVDATITGERVSMRVMMPDGLSYMFSGRVTGNTVNGGYTCYNGGALLERGTWLARRAY